MARSSGDGSPEAIPGESTCRTNRCAGVVASVSNAIDYCPTIVDQSSAAVGPVAVDGKLSLAVASAGNANTGELIVYLT